MMHERCMFFENDPSVYLITATTFRFLVIKQFLTVFFVLYIYKYRQLEPSSFPVCLQGRHFA